MKTTGTILILLLAANYTWGQNKIESTGNVGIGTLTPIAPLEIQQEEDPSSDIGLLITEPNNSQKIKLHLADNQNGEYGYLLLGGSTQLRGNGQPSQLDGSLTLGQADNPVSLKTYGSIRTLHSPSRLLNMFTSSDGNVYFNYIGGSSSSRIGFQIDGSSRMSILNNGSVGIGTINTGSHKLAVDGSIGAHEIKVEVGNWSDFVFEEDYYLLPLKEVERFIDENGHLPDIPSAKEVESDGVNLGEMDSKLLQKIEELTLYVIEQEKRIYQLEERNTALEKEVETIQVLTKRVESLEKSLANNKSR